MNSLPKEEYIRIQTGIIAAARAVSTLDLDAFLAQINTTEAVAPMIDPTLYRKAQANLEGIKKLVQALRPVKIAYTELFHSVLETAARGDMSLPPDKKE